MAQVFYKILLEDGGYLLQEDDGKLLLESVFSDTRTETSKARIFQPGFPVKETSRGRVKQTRTVYL
jgi:hypothetical protein